jgi:hypothetical protein
MKDLSLERSTVMNFVVVVVVVVVVVAVVVMVVAVDACIVAQLFRVDHGLGHRAEALVGEDAGVGAVVRAVPVRAAVLAMVASPAGMADANVL